MKSPAISNRPAISVIIPTYKGAAFIGNTIRSVLDQDLKPHEIIVVNDGSPDDTESVVGRFPSPVKMVKIANIGTTGARHAGILTAEGNWIAFCDHDDLWKPDHLSRLVTLVTDHTLHFAFSNFTHLRGEKPAHESHFEADRSGFWMKPGRKIAEQIFVAEQPLFLNVLAYQAIFPSCMLLSKEFLRRAGGLNAAFGRNVSEDLEFTLRCVVEAPVGVDTRPTVYIRRHGNNYSGDWIRGLADSIEILKFAFTHHSLVPEYKNALTQQIRIRSIEGIDCCFLAKRPREIKYFTPNLVGTDIPFKTRMKIAVCRQPTPIAMPLGSAFVALRNLTRLGSS